MENQEQVNTQSEDTSTPTPSDSVGEGAGASAPASDGVDESVNQLILFWEHTLPRFKMLVDSLSGKSLKRVIKAIIEAPLNQVEVKFQSNVEKEAFLLGSRLQDCKNVMMNLVTAHEAIQRADQEQNGAAQGEVENGTTAVQVAVEGSGLSSETQGAGQGQLPEASGGSESGDLQSSNP